MDAVGHAMSGLPRSSAALRSNVMAPLLSTNAAARKPTHCSDSRWPQRGPPTITLALQAWGSPNGKMRVVSASNPPKWPPGPRTTKHGALTRRTAGWEIITRLASDKISVVAAAKACSEEYATIDAGGVPVSMGTCPGPRGFRCGAGDGDGPKAGERAGDWDASVAESQIHTPPPVVPPAPLAPPAPGTPSRNGLGVAMLASLSEPVDAAKGADGPAAHPGRPQNDLNLRWAAEGVVGVMFEGGSKMEEVGGGGSEHGADDAADAPAPAPPPLQLLPTPLSPAVGPLSVAVVAPRTRVAVDGSASPVAE